MMQENRMELRVVIPACNTGHFHALHSLRWTKLTTFHNKRRIWRQ